MWKQYFKNATWTKRLAVLLALTVLLTALTGLPGEALAAGTGTWTTVGTAGFSAINASFISLAMDDGTPYVAYSDYDNNDRATVMKYTGSGWETVGSPGFSAGDAWHTSLAMDDGTPYVAYRDGGDGGATVMKYTGTGWNTVGSAGFSAGTVGNTSLAMDDGTPYVAYWDDSDSDWTTPNKVTVMKYTGSGWEPVGTPGLSAGEAGYISLAIDDGTPYVAYADDSDSDWTTPNKATVMKYTGTDWEPVGSAGFSAGNTWGISLVIDDGTPYVAYGDDDGNDCRPTVMKYTGTSWEPVGSARFSTGHVEYISLAIDDGTPYVAYQDDSDSDQFTPNKATVMKYTGTDWETVGPAGFSADDAEFISLAMDDGTPYVAYSDGENDGKATVMRFNYAPTDHAPTDIELDSHSVPENEPAGTAVGTLSAQDEDQDDTHTFSLVSGDGGEDNDSFTIDGDTLKTAEVFDYESKDTYGIRIGVTDRGGSTYEKAFTIQVQDVNEVVADMGTVPQGYFGLPYSVVPTVTEGTAPYRWTATGLPAGLGIDGDTGEISGTPAAAGTSAVSATVTDSLDATLTIDFDIVIGYADLAIDTQDLPGVTLGEAYTCALTASGGDYDFTWYASGLPSGLALDEDTGEITGKPLVSGAYPVNVVLRDGRGESESTAYSLIVAPQTQTGQYGITPDTDSAYTVSTIDGFTAMTIEAGVTGFKYFTVSVSPAVANEGEETVVFVQMRRGIQIGFSFIKADFDVVPEAGAGFNVKPGDVIKVYVVDGLSNDPGVNPVVLQ